MLRYIFLYTLNSVSFVETKLSVCLGSKVPINSDGFDSHFKLTRSLCYSTFCSREVFVIKILNNTSVCCTLSESCQGVRKSQLFFVQYFMLVCFQCMFEWILLCMILKLMLHYCTTAYMCLAFWGYKGFDHSIIEKWCFGKKDLWYLRKRLHSKSGIT